MQKKRIRILYTFTYMNIERETWISSHVQSHRQLYGMVPFYMCDHMINLCIISRTIRNFSLLTDTLLPLYSYAKWILFLLCIYCCIYDGFPQTNFFVLELKNGFLRLMYDFGFTNGPVIMESNLAKLHINDARYHEVIAFLGAFINSHSFFKHNA